MIATLKAGPDGWIGWSGGENPVPGRMVVAQTRDGCDTTPRLSETLYWEHEGNENDITAFRLVEEPSTAEEGDYKRPKRGEVRVINGVMQRFVEADDRGDVWEILPAADQVEFTTPTPDRKDDLEPVAWLTSGGDVTRSESYALLQSVNRSDTYPVPLVSGPDAKARIEGLGRALHKINAIRNSIIGFQRMGFSEHVYPLVAALNEAGFEGEEYEVARDKVQTVFDQRDAAVKALERIKDLDTRSHHDGYDNGPGGGNYIYRDVIFTDEVFPIIDQALASIKGEAG